MGALWVPHEVVPTSNFILVFTVLFIILPEIIDVDLFALEPDGQLVGSPEVMLCRAEASLNRVRKLSPRPVYMMLGARAQP
jgi:hypothetical protein